MGNLEADVDNLKKKYREIFQNPEKKFCIK